MSRQPLRVVESPERVTVTVRQPQRGLSPERSAVWARRIMLIGLAAVTALILFAVLGLPTMWVAPVTSFIGAETTRRIMAESNPGLPMRWRDIIGFAWRVSRGVPPVPEFCGPPRPTPEQRRDQLRLVVNNQQHNED
mgnify:CR=1 FL=1